MQAEVDIRNAQIQHQAIEIQEKEAEIYQLQRELKVCANSILSIAITTDVLCLLEGILNVHKCPVLYTWLLATTKTHKQLLILGRGRNNVWATMKNKQNTERNNNNNKNTGFTLAMQGINCLCQIISGR